MEFDYSRLRGRIVEKLQTQKAFGKAIGLSEHSVSVKMNNKKPWRQNEIIRACEVLDIPWNEMPQYFFRV